MSVIILSQGGTIDKYEGDAIIAFFGAPIWTEEHAVLACRSALAMKRKEKELAQRVMDKASPFSKALSGLIAKGTIRAERPLYTRIGINSGDMVVGNMGTTNKMDYTIMGNAVNLASRLEGVNKQYNTSGILLSEYSRAKIGDAFVIRPLSRVRVVGISTPLRLYELLETKEDANAELSAMVEEWNSALALYEKQSFNEAAEIFSSIFRRDSGDHVAELYMKRCKTFGERLPEAWDGVDNLTEK
jgi:class 3 adenylate cyclase